MKALATQAKNVRLGSHAKKLGRSALVPTRISMPNNDASRCKSLHSYKFYLSLRNSVFPRILSACSRQLLLGEDLYGPLLTVHKRRQDTARVRLECLLRDLLWPVYRQVLYANIQNHQYRLPHPLFPRLHLDQEGNKSISFRLEIHITSLFLYITLNVDE